MDIPSTWVVPLSAIAGIFVATVFIFSAGLPLLNPFPGKGKQLTKDSRWAGWSKKCLVMMLGGVIAGFFVFCILGPTNKQEAGVVGMMATRWVHIGDIDKVLGLVGGVMQTARRGRKSRNGKVRGSK